MDKFADKLKIEKQIIPYAINNLFNICEISYRTSYDWYDYLPEYDEGPKLCD